MICMAGLNVRLAIVSWPGRPHLHRSILAIGRLTGGRPAGRTAVSRAAGPVCDKTAGPLLDYI